LSLLLSVNDTKGKKKVLGLNQKLKFNPTELILYCKDLRIVRFCFDEAGPESAKKVRVNQRHLPDNWTALLRGFPFICFE